MILPSTYQLFQQCQLCPRKCGVNRLAGETGFCGETAELRVAIIEPHFGEEPPISGSRGSGTIFFSGCSLKCHFCQNYQISTAGLGMVTSVPQVVQRLQELIEKHGIHNINFVTPDHFIPHCMEIIEHLRHEQFKLPAVFNLSGYQAVSVLKRIENFTDIYLPDFKYSDAKLAKQFSNCPDYPTIALDAIAEMVRQKGWLDVFEMTEATATTARRGVLVRHLILPGQVPNSIDALTTLFLEFGANLPLSLMSQYTPIRGVRSIDLQRRITADEFCQVHDHCLELGFKNLFVQYPESETSLSNPLFLPDFSKSHPFNGNLR